MYVAINKTPNHPLLFDGKRREHLPYLLGKRIAYHAGEEIVRVAVESLADEHKAVELRIAPAVLYIGYLLSETPISSASSDCFIPSSFLRCIIRAPITAFLFSSFTFITYGKCYHLPLLI